MRTYLNYDNWTIRQAQCPICKKMIIYCNLKCQNQIAENRMFRFSLILYFFLSQTILIGQILSADEKAADYLSNSGEYRRAFDICKYALKSNNLSYSDSISLYINESEAFYMADDSSNLAENIKHIDKFLSTHPEIKKNADIISKIHFLKAKLFDLKMNYDSAIIIIDNAINIRKNYYKDSLFAVFLGFNGNYYLKQNNYIKSLRYCILSVKTFKENNLYDKNIVIALLNIAFVKWKLNDFNSYQRILSIILKLINLIKIEDRYIAQTYMSLGTYYLYQSDYFNAYKSYSKVEQLTNIDAHTMLQSQYYLAFTSYLLGDMNLSSSYFKKIKSDFNLLDEYMQLDFNFYYSYTELYSGNYDSSLYYLNKCIDLNKYSNIIKQENVFYAKAKTYYNWNKPDSALKYISIAINKYENKKDPEYSKCLFLKGKIINNNQSEILYSQAKKIAIENYGLKHSTTAYLFKEIGLARFENMQYKQALQDFQQALILVDLDFNSANIFENPKCEHILSAVNLAKALRYKSETLEQIYLQNDSIQYLEAAYATSKLLTEQVEKMLMSYPLFESKQFLMDNSANTFTRAQHLGYLCWKKTEKIQYKGENIVLAEKSRAAILKSQIQDNEFTENVLNDSLTNNLHEIEQNIAYITGQINEYSGSHNSTVVADLKNQLFELNEQKNKICEGYKGEYGNFSHFFKHTTAMSLAQIMNFPAENETVLEYSLCDSIILLNVVQNGKHEIFEIKYDSSLIQKINRYKNIIAPEHVGRLTLVSKSEINEVGTYLYNALLKPAEAMIKNKQLLIVQEPKLGFIPFEAFVLDNKYLIEYQPINYLYSINISDGDKHNRAFVKDCKMAAFLPCYDFKKENVTAYSKKFYETLLPLDYKKESESLYEVSACDTFLVNSATEENFKKLAGNYTVLHLALHSILNPENFVLSKLCFTAVNDTLNDGIFNLCDVTPLKLNAELTFLSGCNTGGGQIIAGEGVMSFARSFILAGSRSIIMSLWELNNNSAIDINTGFYKYLNEGYNKAEALQMSKIDYIKKSDKLHKHPFFWSGIVLIGNKEHIEISKPYTLLQKTAFALGILVIVFVIFMFIKKRKQIFNNDTEEEIGDCCG